MLAGFKALNHPQQTSDRGAVDDIDDRATDPAVWHVLDRRFGGFTLDVAASTQNHKTARYFTADDDGLAHSWAGERVWCNPPYSRIGPWVRKAWDEWPHTHGIVMLLPANRTEQSWWQELIEPRRDRGQGFTTEFLAGRLRFMRPGETTILPNRRPPFGCVLLHWADPTSPDSGEGDR